MLFLIALPLFVHAGDDFSSLPSEETKKHIKDLSTSSNRLPTRDWWSESRNGGPPGSGTGGGGAVGATLINGTLPVLTIGMLYVVFIAVKRTRKRK